MSDLSAGLKPGRTVEAKPVDVDMEVEIGGKELIAAGAEEGISVSKCGSRRIECVTELVSGTLS